ncbi:flagellar biosynthesis protein FlgJ [Jannaschia formosa]|uniref:flagellar biosynthesis protein FlgJ n=1 Tax=Jannaschia formosa TaxID=2259592 RepID=UPI000E1BA9F3|nr:flagellar biosynthesis protein FlgJ [Jannaschia formosa]TFL18959.1 flagellar biosynthesis protein FlgJ [Jannaschia formosa]
MFPTDPTRDPTGATRLVAPPAPDPKAQRILEQARQLEALLFAEMLKASGTGPPGMAGTDSPFEGFLRTAQAEAVTSSGQTGLAEAIAASLMRQG